MFGTGFSSVYAHTTVEVGTYEIEVGWQDEPPVVGILNAITVDISEPNKETGIFTNVTNGFRNMDATVISGGATKILDINSELDSFIESEEFDDNFTWSAMVLAAQGKKINQITITYSFFLNPHQLFCLPLCELRFRRTRKLVKECSLIPSRSHWDI